MNAEPNIIRPNTVKSWGESSLFRGLGTELLISGATQTTRYRIVDGFPLSTLHHAIPGTEKTAVALSPDESVMALSYSDEALRIWELETEVLFDTRNAHEAAFQSALYQRHIAHTWLPLFVIDTYPEDCLHAPILYPFKLRNICNTKLLLLDPYFN